MLRDGLRPCLIVLDMAMPEMDGFEFRRQRMADPTLAELPVAVMSGGGWATDADARKLGLTLFFRKPVEPAELLRAFTDTAAKNQTDTTRCRGRNTLPFGQGTASTWTFSVAC